MKFFFLLYSPSAYQRLSGESCDNLIFFPPLHSSYSYSPLAYQQLSGKNFDILRIFPYTFFFSPCSSSSSSPLLSPHPRSHVCVYMVRLVNSFGSLTFFFLLSLMFLFLCSFFPPLFLFTLLSLQNDLLTLEE